MNTEILEEQWLNFSWLGYSMPLVDLIRFLGCFLSLIYWVLNLLVIKRLWKDPWMFKRFRDEKQRRKVEIPISLTLGRRAC